MTTTVDNLRAVIDRLEDAGIDLGGVEFDWHNVSEELAQQIVGLFPDRKWVAHGSSGYKWVTVVVDGVELTAFLPEPRPAGARWGAHHRVRAV